MSPHISPTELLAMKDADFLDCEQFVIGEERETYASYWADQTGGLSQDFSLHSEPEGPDPGWHMEWTWRFEMLLIHRLRDPRPMIASYGAEGLWHLTHRPTSEEGRAVRVVPLPPGGGARTRQRGSSSRTRGGRTSRMVRCTEDDSDPSQ
ncbi:hypothetical protein GIB67_038080 [Kingdonia uniflora]|uniref:Uncharacterized protein n=1 Tax=Kingdonia uniflora TaxID=39325 RepID=A0A7J7LZB1_9MAGN|nr:hypothetical protein GIB67_038080 [Kingdonia uniflora]